MAEITFQQAFEEFVVLLENERDELVGKFIKDPTARRSKAKLRQTADAFLARQLAIEAARRVLADRRPGRSDALVP